MGFRFLTKNPSENASENPSENPSENRPLWAICVPVPEGQEYCDPCGGEGFYRTGRVPDSWHSPGYIVIEECEVCNGAGLVALQD